MVERITRPDVFHRKRVPGEIGPEHSARVTARFHSGQRLMSVWMDHTTARGALIMVCEEATTGAFRLTSMARPLASRFQRLDKSKGFIASATAVAQRKPSSTVQ